MLRFVTLGVGAAVVNGCVTLPPELVARPVSDLPKVSYYAVHEPGALRDPRVRELLEAIRNQVFVA